MELVGYEDDEARSILVFSQDVVHSLVNEKFTSKDFEAVMIKPYRGKPILIKDGERVDNKNMSSFDINWTWDSKVEMNISNE